MGSTARANAVAFEALFQKWKQQPGALLEELQRLGVEPERIEPSYPFETFIAVLESMGRHLFPELTGTAANRAIGRGYVEGYLASSKAETMGVMLELTPGEPGLRRMPRGVMDDFPGIQLLYLRDGSAPGQVEIEGAPLAFAEFLAGAIECGMSRATRAFELEVEARGPLQSTIWVRLLDAPAATHSLVR